MLRRSAPLACLFVLLLPGVAAGQDAGEVHDQVVLSGDVLVARGQTVGDVIVFSGSARIEGVARGVVVVLEGPVEVKGQVGGDVVAADGSVTLGPTAQVAGDVLAGEDISASPGAHVSGNMKDQINFSLAGPLAALGTLRAPVAVGVSVLVALLLLLLMAPVGADRVAATARDAPVKSLVWGLLLVAGFPLVAVAGAVSVLAMPFGLSALLALGLFWLVGQAFATWTIGRLFAAEPRSRYLALLEGWVLGAAVGLVPYLNVVWWVGGSTFGLGAMVVASWRARGLGAAPVPPTRAGKHRKGITATPSSAPSSATPATPLAED